MHAVSLRLPDHLGERLAYLAERTGRSKTYYMIEAIQEHIDTLEDIYLAEEILQRVRRGEERIYSSEQVEAMLNVEN